MKIQYKYKFEPFSKQNIDKLFDYDDVGKPFSIKKESSSIEYKENFNWGAIHQCAKEMVAFANRGGGYLIFGVKDDTREIIGIKGDGYKNTKPEKITEYLNQRFSPAIDWDIFEKTIGEKVVVLFYIYEGIDKPVMCIKDCGEIHPSDIIYRYGERSEKIKYPELKTIIDKNRENNDKKWITMLQNLIKIGVENSSIIDLSSGSFDAYGKCFTIDSSSLNKMMLSNEIDKTGDNGLPIMKDVSPVIHIESNFKSKNTTIEKIKYIDLSSITSDFLDKTQIDEPLIYLKRITESNTASVPIYYYIYLTKKPIDKIIEMIEEIKPNSCGKTHLLKRLTHDKDYHYDIKNSNTNAFIKKKYFSDIIKNKESISFENIEESDYKYIFQSIQNLNDLDIDWKYISELLKTINNMIETERFIQINPIKTGFRSTICYLDQVLYKHLCK